MGDLQDVHGPPARTVPQQLPLSGRFEVTEQEQPQPGAVDQQGHARVVGAVGRRPRPRPGGRRPEHLPGQRADPAPLPRPGHLHRDARGGRGPPHERGLARWFGQRGGLDHPDGPSAQHAGQPAHVVGVKMCQKQQRHPPHPQGPQTRVHRSGIRAGVHDHRRPRPRGQHARVPLAHRALHVAPPGRRPAGEGPDELRGPQQGEEQEQGRRRAGPAVPAQPRRQSHDAQGHRRQQQAPADPARPGQLRPGQLRTRPGHGGDPPGGHPRAPGQRPRRGHPHRGNGERGEPQHGRRTGRQLGQQIAGHRHQTHPGREHRHHR